MDYNILLYKVAGNTVNMYILFASLLAGSVILLKLFKYIIFSRIKKLTETSGFITDDLIFVFVEKNIIPMAYIAAIYFSSGVLVFGSGLQKWLYYFFLILVAFFITRFFTSVVALLVNRFWFVKDDKEGGGSVAVLINMVIRIILWSVSLLILLDNLGIKVSGLIAGLGVGGVAIAFAAQSILQDIFNYFTIFFDRPFEIGDFLVVDNFKGVVEHIGVKTTRLRSLGGEQLIFANTDLTGSRVRNFKNMQERRVVFSFGVTYQTSARIMEKITEEIRKIVEGMEYVRFDRAHFFKFGESSLDFEVVYYVLSGEYSVYMDLQQDINIKIMKLLEKMKVDFAYPTRTIFMNKEK